jgi:hypothetical protein
MHTKLFVGLTFFPDTSFAKIIDSFRARYDDKYDSNPYLHLPIVPPFEVEPADLKNVQQELIEELESFYFENLEGHALDFSGLNVEEHKKRKIVFMSPKIDEDLGFCQESLFSICQSYINDREKKLKESSKKTYMTIARLHGDDELHSCLAQAQIEFQNFTALPFESICLFSKNNGIWYREADLITFERNSDPLLLSSRVPV